MLVRQIRWNGQDTLLPSAVYVRRRAQKKRKKRNHLASHACAIRYARAAKPPVQLRYDPLYLFHCGLDWHVNAETSAGWELVQAMRYGNRGARAQAAELLARTENGRLLVRDLRRTRGGCARLQILPKVALALPTISSRRQGK